MLLWSVPLELRAFALAIAETLQHVLGDIPSPPVVGKVQDAVESWRLTLCLANVWMAVAALCCFLGAWCAPRARDYHREELQAREVTEQVVLLRDGHAHGAAADLVARMGADLTRRRPVPDEVG
ncbi:hypothetical protein H632_c1632p0 [Helicosporidium sp. ATCC 50920]|nr:hypothetical protein H632_c1632p0 [Helicosporidium sp. ATCC 50920]|eukprot:KDD74036.1 hypothetical protein H632_c1632p0 [Helicosporidium sp. ATCC 50920]